MKKLHILSIMSFTTMFLLLCSFYYTESPISNSIIQTEKKPVKLKVVQNQIQKIVTISFEAEDIKNSYVRIYNVIGALVYEFDQSNLESGFNSITWNCTDTYGIFVPNGVYFCKVYANQTISSMKFMVN